MKNGISKKTVPGILRFVSVPFLNIYKGNNEKVVLVFVSILFFICEKRIRPKTVPGISRFTSTLSWYLKYGISKKTVTGTLEFVIILFQYLKKKE